MEEVSEQHLIIYYCDPGVRSSILPVQYGKISIVRIKQVIYYLGLVLGLVVFLMQFLLLYCSSHFLVKKNRYR